MSKCGQESQAKCFYLGVDSEMHIQTKIRKRKPQGQSDKHEVAGSEQDNQTEATKPAQEVGQVTSDILV